jgi:HD-like signal output (HDOD) protein
MDSNTTEDGDSDHGGTSPANAPSLLVDMATSMSVTPAAVTTASLDAIYGDIAPLFREFHLQYWRFPSSWSELVNDGQHSTSNGATCKQTCLLVTLVRAEWELDSGPGTNLNNQPLPQETSQAEPTLETDDASKALKNTEIDRQYLSPDIPKAERVPETVHVGKASLPH